MNHNRPSCHQMFQADSLLQSNVSVYKPSRVSCRSNHAIITKQRLSRMSEVSHHKICRDFQACPTKTLAQHAGFEAPPVTDTAQPIAAEPTASPPSDMETTEGSTESDEKGIGDDSSSNIGVIVGVIVAAIAGLLSLIGFLIYRNGRSDKDKQVRLSDSVILCHSFACTWEAVESMGYLSKGGRFCANRKRSTSMPIGLGFGCTTNTVKSDGEAIIG